MYPYIRIFNITIPSYGLCMVIAIFVTFLVAIFRRKIENLLWEDVLIVCASGLGFALVGAKLLFVLVSYSLSEILANITSFDLAFMFQDGLVFYGGLIGGLIGSIIGCKLAGISLHKLDKVIVPIIPIAHGIGRVGCFLAGCCAGVDGIHIQLIEALINVGLGVLLLALSSRMNTRFGMLWCYTFMYSIERFVLEMFRGDEVRGFVGKLSTSQVISVIILVICIVLYKKIWIEKKENCK